MLENIPGGYVGMKIMKLISYLPKIELKLPSGGAGAIVPRISGNMKLVPPPCHC